MSDVRFLRCARCGNVFAVLVDGGVTPLCCGEPMVPLVAGTSDGAREKHVPAVTRAGDELCVRVGSVDHPMLAAHYIQLIAVAYGAHLEVTRLAPGDEPAAKFAVPAGQAATVYELCNLHGLWSAPA